MFVVLKKKNNSWTVVLTVLFIFSIFSCTETYFPKPEGYMRISLPNHTYEIFNEEKYPISFKLPSSARVVPKSFSTGNAKFNIDYPKLNAKIHLSFNVLENNLGKYLEETRELTYKHHEKASDIDKQTIIDDANQVYGLKYYVSGNVATSTQFYLTDSTHNFLRGALYFWAKPNEDSLALVTDFVRQDIDTIISSLQWKSPNADHSN